MSRTSNADLNRPQVYDCCIMCLRSFGIVDEFIPRECINEKCRRQFCSQCVKDIQIYNGNDRPFQCMYCLHKYPLKCVPMENEMLKQQLWNDAVIKYGLKRTDHLLSTQCNATDLEFDIDCRRRHLINLISTRKKLANTTGIEETFAEAENMTNQLSQIVQHLQSHPNDKMDLFKEIYRQTISLPNNDEDVGLLYMRLCERLFVEISYAEFCSIFPNTNEKMNEWTCEQVSGDGFQPKIFDLIKVVEQDLINHWSNPRCIPRTKIGVIGYTSAGKSSVLNRLLGVSSLTDDNAAPVRTIKSTYYQLQFDRQELLTDPLNRETKIPITLVDIQGLDKGMPTVNTQVEAGNYLDEIRKADCDIYVLVFDDQLCDEQEGWISYIEQTLERKCVLVRSKVDISYLIKFRELSGTFFSKSTQEQRSRYALNIIEQIRFENAVKSRHVYLTAADYSPHSIDGDMLLENQSFDLNILLDELGSLSFNARDRRIHSLANRTVARAINTCFRRGYVLNVLKYKIAAGFAAIIPFGDQLPRYLSRNSIREAFGINDDFLQYLTQFNLIIDDGHLQTSVFEGCVEVKTKIESKLSARTAGTAVGYTTAIVGSFSDDIIRVAAPATTTTLSTAGRLAFTLATVGIGVILSAGVCAWSAISSGKHIFSYVNRICDDAILVIDPMITSIIERENKKSISNPCSKASN